MEPMRMMFKLREPKIGMKVVSKRETCCFGMPKNDVGVIVKIDENGLEFTVKDWKNSELNHCVQCVSELRDVSKEEWITMCDAEAAGKRRK